MHGSFICVDDGSSLGGSGGSGVTEWDGIAERTDKCGRASTFPNSVRCLSSTTLPVEHVTHAPDLAPPSPSQSVSPTSTLAPPTPEPTPVLAVCNAPLIQPKPLPYRPPAFLSQFELPDPDEDLSYPPYTTSRGKRKRSRDDSDEHNEDPGRVYGKRRATEAAIRPLPPPSSYTSHLNSHRRSLS